MLNLIYAKSRNNVIGKNGTLPWDLPEDLAHFKKTTLGCPVIMGVNTWKSLPQAFRPLPGRRNIVVSRRLTEAPAGAELASSLLEASKLVPLGRDAWVIGGERLFEEAIPVATRIVVTEIDIDVEGDTYAPILGRNWVEASRERHVSTNGMRYSIVEYRRKVPLHKDPDQDKRSSPFLDIGPWHAGATHEQGRQRVYVESWGSSPDSNDVPFFDDVRLYVDGNFGGIEDKMEYARGLAEFLNKAVQEQARGSEKTSS